MTRPRMVVSGGQTGVDRAALDTALALGIPCGGWCPRGRRAEDGPIPPRYPLRETVTASYGERTRLNVADSDATLVLASPGHDPAGGTALTIRTAAGLGRPLLVVDPCAGPRSVAHAADWLRSTRPAVLNVAGPREGAAPGTYRTAREFLERLWQRTGDAVEGRGTTE